MKVKGINIHIFLGDLRIKIKRFTCKLHRIQSIIYDWCCLFNLTYIFMPHCVFLYRVFNVEERGDIIKLTRLN